MAIESMFPISSRIEERLDLSVDRSLPFTDDFSRDAKNMRSNMRPSTIISRAPEGWDKPQSGNLPNRSAFGSEPDQSSWRPTSGPWGPSTFMPAPAPALESQPKLVQEHEHEEVTDLRKVAAEKFISAVASLQEGLAGSATAISDFGEGKYLSGLHYGVSSSGYVLQGIGQVLDGFSYDLKASGNSDIADDFQRWSKTFNAYAAPLVGLGRSLHDLDRAFTTLADPNRSFKEKKRDFELAIGTFLNAIGESANAADALIGKPEDFLHNVQEAMASSGSILRGLKLLQLNAQKFHQALSPFDLGKVLASSAGMAYGSSEALEGMLHALAAAFEKSGYTHASETLSALGERAGDAHLFAASAEKWINLYFRRRDEHA